MEINQPSIFACQRDSFLKELTTEVLSCEKSTLKVPGCKPIKGYDVIFADTILFPEGGGQNDDNGTANGQKVRKVTRKNGKAIHFVESDAPLTPGETIVQKLDWKRRFDHMQQHSGQHLISAYFEQIYNMDTLSWWMAENQEDKVGVSYIELDAEVVHQDQIDRVQHACNDAIRNHVPVQVHVYDEGSEELKAAKTRGLPADHVGPVRVIQIGEIDRNMCCGTHVSNLSQLQMIQILYGEKRKGKSFVYFLVGDRVNQYIENCFRREKLLTTVLNGGPEQHTTLAEKAMKNSKKYQKTTQSLLKELAVEKAEEIKKTKPRYFSVHRPENEMDYVNVLLSELSELEMTIFVSMGNEKEGGPFAFVLQSSEKVVQEIGKQIMQVLEAKGGGKGKRINGKFMSLMNRDKVDVLLQNYHDN